MSISLFCKCLGKARSILDKWLPGAMPEVYPCDHNPESVAQTVEKLLVSKGPCMIARFGSTELGCVINYLRVKDGKRNPISYLLGKSDMWWWNQGAIDNLSNMSGFFPKGRVDLVEKFCELFLKDIEQLDLLGSWHPNEKYLDTRIHDVPKVFLPYLEPYWSSKPWSKVLEGKRVLVVHPFAELIERQYNNCRTELFANPDVLPLFHLETVKAIQSLGGAYEGDGSRVIRTWFDALDHMKEQIDFHDYDICIIGCGAYGFHLAAHVKRSGKKAVHMGGATQLMFGIKGNRWEDPDYGVAEWGIPRGYYSGMFNGHWIKAGESDKPANAQQVENACYW